MKLDKIASYKSLLQKEFKSNLRSLDAFSTKLITKNPAIVEAVKFSFAILPGVVFMALGLCMLFAPQYLALFLCAFLLSFGVAALLVGLKVNQLRIKFKKVSAQIEARVLIDPQAFAGMQSTKKYSGFTRADMDEQLTTIKTNRKSSDLKDSAQTKGDIVIQLSDGKKVIYH